MYYVLLVVMSLFSGLCFEEYPKEKDPSLVEKHASSVCYGSIHDDCDGDGVQ